MKTLDCLTGGGIALISSVAGSPAKTLAKPSKEPKGSAAPDPASGSKCNALSKNADPASRLSKIPPDFAVADWIKFSGFSLRSGTMRNGIVSPRAPLTRRMKETGSTLWPTPTASRRSGLQSHGKNALLGPVNPTFLEWLMGFEINHTDVEYSETPLSRKSRKQSAAP